ncbi:MAG: molecular chaperone DnaK [Bdellovibrionales bacterium RBG_16_40_8]|nr:MAG: molecular chaperone DnaK [Bdellovibrionales bacterium RBG_16_40_8]
MKSISESTITVCKEQLLRIKANLLNRMRENHSDYHSHDRGGDEADLAANVLAEGTFLTVQERLRAQLLEVEVALAKIERGIYGICEETEEPIETERLLAIPWTRLSVEGAEIHEDLSKRYAK